MDPPHLKEKKLLLLAAGDEETLMCALVTFAVKMKHLHRRSRSTSHRAW